MLTFKYCLLNNLFEAFVSFEKMEFVNVVADLSCIYGTLHGCFFDKSI
jgi:hypothetical protein